MACPYPEIYCLFCLAKNPIPMARYIGQEAGIKHEYPEGRYVHACDACGGRSSLYIDDLRFHVLEMQSRVRMQSEGINPKTRQEHDLICYGYCLEIDPYSARAWAEKGSTLLDLSKPEQALTCFSRALEINPRDSDTWFARGIAFKRLGQVEEALTCYDKSLEIEPSVVVWKNKELSLQALGRYDEALLCCCRGLEIDSKRPDPWIDREVKPDLWNDRGVILAKLSRSHEALACYERGLQIVFPLPDIRHIRLQRNKEMLLLDLGRYEEALACNDRLLEIEPADPSDWKNRGTILKALGRTAEAEEAFARACM